MLVYPYAVSESERSAFYCLFRPDKHPTNWWNLYQNFFKKVPYFPDNKGDFFVLFSLIHSWETKSLKEAYAGMRSMLGIYLFKTVSVLLKLHNDEDEYYVQNRANVVDVVYQRGFSGEYNFKHVSEILNCHADIEARTLYAKINKINVNDPSAWKSISSADYDEHREQFFKELMTILFLLKPVVAYLITVSAYANTSRLKSSLLMGYPFDNLSESALDRFLTTVDKTSLDPDFYYSYLLEACCNNGTFKLSLPLFLKNFYASEEGREFLEALKTEDFVDYEKLCLSAERCALDLLLGRRRSLSRSSSGSSWTT